MKDGLGKTFKGQYVNSEMRFMYWPFLLLTFGSLEVGAVEFMAELVDLSDDRQRLEIEALLGENGIRLDDRPDLTLALRCGQELAATGSITGNTLRSIAVRAAYQGGNCLNVLISQLTEVLHRKGVHPVFVYTKPEAVQSFQRLGFYSVASTEDVALLENTPIAFQRYLDSLSEARTISEPAAGIVMNGNPFTRGHRHLVETACRENAHVHLFVVSSEASSFPFAVRYRLIQEGTVHLKNLTLHAGGDYIISGATFPRYFLREADSVSRIQAELDIRLFGSRIAKALGITRRYVGEEPYCMTTRLYNETMKTILPEYGIQVHEIKRLEDPGGAISASRVRNSLRQGGFDELSGLVPESTYKYLCSEDFRLLRERISGGENKH